MAATAHKQTGPGKLVQLPDGSTLLFNFDIDGTTLKPEHRAFLERNVLSAANASPDGLRVVLGGSADRLGDAGYNVALSNRRIEAVSTFLKQRKPGYPWSFEGFGQGVGEATAERAGDKDGTRDDLFRSVIVEVLAPGKPVPPKPYIPNSFPKKPNVVPRLLGRPDQGTCMTEQDCPHSRTFSIQLLAGATAGEIVEGAGLVFWIKDLENRLRCLYTLTGGGLAIPGPLPVSVVAVGKPAPFFPTKPTKVTNFGPIGGISSLTVQPGPAMPMWTPYSVLDFTFHESGRFLPSGHVFIREFDTGPISLPGWGIHGGLFKPHDVCRGAAGADRE